MDQRYVSLEILNKSGNAVTLKSPPNGNVAPPGYYLLFALNQKGVPSTGQFLNIT
jgi:hypothetical protein